MVSTGETTSVPPALLHTIYILKKNSFVIPYSNL